MSTKGKRITISCAETVYRERSFNRTQVIDMLTDELDEPIADRQKLANMSEGELADVLAEHLKESNELADMLTEGYYELYERDSVPDGPFVVEVRQ